MVRYCLIFNPTAGRRRNERRLEQLRARLSGSVEVRPTLGIGDATRLARVAAEEGFTAVIAAGGDGTVHEVASGLLQAGVPDATLAIFPVGSANDYAHSLLREFGDTVRGPDFGVVVDVGRVRGLSDDDAFFVNSVGLGFAGAVTIRSRSIGWLRGVPLYGLAACRALWHDYLVEPWEVQFDEQPPEIRPTLMLSLLNGRREGNFVLAPDASLADGWFDFAHAGALSRWDIVRLLPSLARSGPPSDDPNIWLGRCRRLTVRAPIALAAHVDGEIISRPEHGRRECSVEILSQRLRVQVLDAS